MLEKDVQLSIIILEANDRKELVDFRRLLEITGWDRSTLSRLLDKLRDYTIAYEDWEKDIEGWRHCWYIDKDAEYLVRKFAGRSQ